MATFDESALKSRLVHQCRELGWYARRIEDQYGVGILDTFIVPTGRPTLFVEAKLTDGIKFAPTERQWVEGKEIMAANGQAIAVLIGWRNRVMYISNWRHEAYITKAFAQVPGLNYAKSLEAWLNERQESSY